MRGPESWLSREKCLVSTVIRLRAIFQLWISWRWMALMGSARLLTNLQNGWWSCLWAAIASVPLYFIAAWKPRRANWFKLFIKAITKMEIGNENRTEHRFELTALLPRRNRLLITFEVEAIEEKPWSLQIRSATRLSTSPGWVFELRHRTSCCSFAFLDSQPPFQMVLHATRRPRHFVVGLIFSIDKKNGPKFPI